MTASEAASPPYTLAAEKAAGRNGQVNGEKEILSREKSFKCLFLFSVGLFGDSPMTATKSSKFIPVSSFPEDNEGRSNFPWVHDHGRGGTTS